jgi:DNA-binding transcriptional LysR family regulator
MELRRLEYFAAVARHGSFTRAAEELWITQSALSQQVRRLEAELGVTLLRRTPRGAELTSAGEELLPRAETILDEVAHARADLDRHAGVTRGRVRVAATTMDTPRLPSALAAFHREHPGLQIALRHAPAAEIAALVASGAADVGVASPHGPAPAGVEAIALAEQPLRVMLPPDDALVVGDEGARAGAGRTDGAGRVSVVALADLRGRPFILAEPGTALRETVMAACQADGFSPVPLFEVSDPGTVRFLAHAGLGVSVVPASWLEQPGPAVAVAELAEPAPRHRVALLVRAGRETPAGRLLRDALLEDLG